MSLKDLKVGASRVFAVTEDGDSVFTLHTIGFKGAAPNPHFTFNASDMNDAVSKAKGWCHYHSWKYGEDAVVKPAAGKELNWETHNEYVEGK